MSKKGPVALKAESGGKIFADGANIKGYERVAESDDESLITLNDAEIELPSKDSTGIENTNSKTWFQKPIGIVILGVVVGVILLFIENFFS